MANSIIVVGVQWGDEGKGKVVDLLSEQADYVVRSQGGNNAGHTIIVKDKEYKFHLVPSGALHPNSKCLVTGGTVIDPSVIASEIKGLENNGVVLKDRLKISCFAHIIMPYHRALDKLYEMQKGKDAVGTTGKGIGPCYSDKALRVGFQLGELINPSKFKQKLESILKIKNNELKLLFDHPGFDSEEVYQEYINYAKELQSYITDGVETELAIALKSGKKVLFEGAHGTYLDTTYGTYPYVTSSSTLASGVSAGAGVGPTRIGHVLGIVKAYTTRVGNGPLPTALTDEESKLFMDNISAREVGTTTGRNRRLAWFDAPLIRQAIHFNGVDSMAIMKLDILDKLKEIKICVAYQHRNTTIQTPPSLTVDWEEMKPVYQTMPGWMTPTGHITSYQDLPENAKLYLKKLEELCDCPISILSLGPEREKTLFLKDLLKG